MKERMISTALFILIVCAFASSSVMQAECCGKTKEQSSKSTLTDRIKKRMQGMMKTIKQKLTNEPEAEESETECVCENQECLNCPTESDEKEEVAQTKQKRQVKRNKENTTETTVVTNEEQMEEAELSEQETAQQQTTKAKRTSQRRAQRAPLAGKKEECCKGCPCGTVEQVIDEVIETVAEVAENIDELEEEAGDLLVTVLNEIKPQQKQIQRKKTT